MTHEAWRRGGFRIMAFSALFLWPLWIGWRMLTSAVMAMAEEAKEVPALVREMYTLRFLLGIWTGGRSEDEFNRREAVEQRDAWLEHRRSYQRKVNA